MRADERRVIVTSHAIAQARARFLGKNRQAAHLIVRDVVQALREGRVKKRKPRWLMQTDLPRRRQLHGTYRFVWNEERDRAYVLKQESNEKGEPVWLVLTAFAVEAEQ